MRALGLSFSGHGTAACLVEDGTVVRAVNLERLTRVKYATALPPDPSFLAVVEGANQDAEARRIASRLSFDTVGATRRMLEYLTGETDPARAGLDLVVRPRHPFRLGERPEVIRDDQALRAFFGATPCHFDVEHHLLHAYQAFLASPFEVAAIATLDGTGDELDRHGRGISASLGIGRGNHVEVLHEVPLPSSVGGFYGTATHHLGFAFDQEGNTMALAAFGSDRFDALLRDTVLLRSDGTFEAKPGPEPGLWPSLDASAPLCTIRSICPRRAGREAPITDVHKDLAHAVQALCEHVVSNVLSGLRRATNLANVAMAGGVALNCVANAKALESSGFEDLHVTPNAGDRGLALGAALYGCHVVGGHSRRDPPTHDYHGRSYSTGEIRSALAEATGIEWRESRDIARECASLLASGQIIGWFQGGAEFGPRALGHRSILADPRTVKSKERLDREIKRREWFRPYAPSVLEGFASDYFEMRGKSPYMLRAVSAKPKARSEVPGVVHVDGSVRVQTVSAAEEPLFHRLIEIFAELTGVPMVMNTSFNGYGEPIIERPSEAIAALGAMSLDALALGDCIVRRAPKV